MFGLGFKVAGVAAAVGLAAVGVQTWRVDRLKAEVADREAQLVQVRAELKTAAATIALRDKALADDAATAKTEAAELAATMKGTCRAAFDAGYAARRCAPGEPAGVRDLQGLWSPGAFPGAPGLPAQP